MAVAGFAALFLVPAASADSPPSLGTADSFVVLGGSSVANTGPTLVTGNVGVSPGSEVHGLSGSNFTVGKIYANDSTARQAQRDNAAAYSDLASRTCMEANKLSGFPNPNTPLTPGVYCFSTSSPVLPGKLTLHGTGAETDVWVLQITGSLTTAANSSVVLDGAISSNVFWQVGDSATLGAQSTFVGSILARGNIAVGAGVSLSGRFLTQTGAVTLESDDVVLCCDPLTFSPLTLPKGKVNTPYSATVMATGGTAPNTFKEFGNALPKELTISSTGQITGTPMTGGTFPFTVLATDVRGCSTIHAYEIVICGNIAVLPEVLPPAPPSCAIYQQQLSASGGTEPYTFTYDLLPAGFTLTRDGLLTGQTMTQECTTFTVTATDQNGCTGTRTYVICGLTVLPETLPDAVVNEPYSVALVASGGIPPYVFTVCAGVLPPGLGPGPQLPNGILTGKPTQEGKYPFSVTVVDAIGVGIGSRQYTICVTKPITLPDATVGAFYSHLIAGTDPSPLPPGLGNTPLLSGTPTKKGTFSFTVKTINAFGCDVRQEYIITINCPILMLSTPPTPVVNVPLNYQFTVSGLQGSFEYSYTGTLPTGLSLSKGGFLSPTPTRADPFDYIVTAVDTVSGCTVSKEYIGPTICLQPITISPATLPNGGVGVLYKQQLVASGGSGSYTYSPEGKLNDWLSLDSTTGLLSGTPTVAGPYTFTVTATDKDTNCSGSMTYTIQIGCTSSIVVSPPSTSLMSTYNQVFTASGGTPPYTFVVVVPSSLPVGLSLSSTGMLSGSLATPGRYNFGVQATDSKGLSSCPQVYSIFGTAPPVIPSIPVLSRWELLLISILLAATAVAAIRRAQ